MNPTIILCFVNVDFFSISMNSEFTSFWWIFEFLIGEDSVMFVIMMSGAIVMKQQTIHRNWHVKWSEWNYDNLKYVSCENSYTLWIYFKTHWLFMTLEGLLLVYKNIECNIMFSLLHLLNTFNIKIDDD